MLDILIFLLFFYLGYKGVRSIFDRAEASVVGMHIEGRREGKRTRL